MTTTSHVKLLKEGVDVFNKWRAQHLEETIDLRDIHLGNISLPKVNLSRALLNHSRLRWAYMREAKLADASLMGSDLRIIDLSKADLSRADLTGANLSGAYLRQTNLSGANLFRANLLGANLDQANLMGANLQKANLRNTVLVDADLTHTNLSDCNVYGASVWNCNTSDSIQENLIITRPKEPKITVDNLKVAQFIYLILNNQEIREVIDTVGRKGVLILGRFSKDRKMVLYALKYELRTRNYIPIIFDFEKPLHLDLTETISVLAHLSSFIIADITEAKSIPQELKSIIPNLPSIPIQPIILHNHYHYSLFSDFAGHLSLLPPFKYNNIEHLLSSLEDFIIIPAINKSKEINERRKVFEQLLNQNVIN